MSAHTPGPWTYGAALGRALTDDAEPEIAFHEIVAGGRIIASTWAGPHEDNARLIAAAPALAEALHDMVKLTYGHELQRDQFAAELMERARAALTAAGIE